MEEVLIHRKEEFHQNVYVYGTGVVASLLSFFLEKHGFTDFEYVVSRNQCKRRSFRGKYVCYISEISSRDEVILALNPDTQKEVSEELRKQGFQNLYYVNTYGIA
jgi:prephenate dehydrogenase